MIQLDFRSRTKNPTPTPPKNLRLLTTPTPQPYFEQHIFLRFTYFRTINQTWLL